MAVLVSFATTLLALWHLESYAVPKPVVPQAAATSLAKEKTTPLRVLNSADRLAYNRIFELQKKADWKTADQVIAQLDNPILLGHVQAQRYLHPKYISKPSELKKWLEAYRDLPQAAQIYSLARHKGLGNLTAPKTVAAYSSGIANSTRPINRFGKTLLNQKLTKGRILHNRLRTLLNAGKRGMAINLLASARRLDAREYDLLRWMVANSCFNNGEYRQAALLASASADRSGASLPALNWLAGLTHWHQGNTPLAYRYFSNMARAKRHLTDSDIAAASFWAWRAAMKLNNEQMAMRHLKQAALYPNTFYGIQAGHALEQRIGLQLKPHRLTHWDLETLTREKTIRRIIALNEASRSTEAEQEMRAYYLSTHRSEQPRLLALASLLDMPALQMRMARDLTRKDNQLDYASFPTPAWQPYEGYAIDPSLIFAIARQESGFNPTARSHAGAFGIMQLMPATTRYLLRNAPPHLKRANIHDPVTNISLGQQYLHYLRQQPMIGDNLVFLIASYNAGPNPVANWQRELNYQNDPLLFIESIPFVETRGYVQHVLTNYWIYNEIIGHDNPSLTSLLAGNWPSYKLTSQQLASTVDYLQQRGFSKNAL